VKAAYELTQLFLRLWLCGAVLIFFFSLSDFVFRRPHGVMMLLRRLRFSFIWPLALLSQKGRDSLFGKFKGI
jgi:hypothetical protein